VTARPRRRFPAGITRLSVEGYKSLRTRQEIEIRPLTIIAGINSSGKSSALQPLLLLKQTIDAPYDPGPLQLDGPNVSVTAIEQVLSKTNVRTEQARSFTVGITTGGGGQTTQIVFGKDSKSDLRVLEMSGWFFAEQTEPITLRERMTDAQLRRALPAELLARYTSVAGEPEELRVSVRRDRSFLFPVLVSGDGSRTSTLLLGDVRVQGLQRDLSRMIHLPALRGNPRRTYRTAAVGERYQGTFEAYTAGIIAAWQNNHRTAELQQLRVDLEELGLTWKVEARQFDDTQVQLMVGRLPRARSGGAWDLVNIADVGFGVSQTLPVIVALGVAQPGQLVYLEQPEIHLHPRAQFKFGQVVSRALKRGVRVVVETHSSLFIRSVQELVAKADLKPVDVALHWFTRDPQSGDTQISTGELDDDGAFGDWPEDFDEVHLQAEASYLDAVARRMST
jgi:predicted ATPase